MSKITNHQYWIIIDIGLQETETRAVIALTVHEEVQILDASFVGTRSYRIQPKMYGRKPLLAGVPKVGDYSPYTLVPYSLVSTRI